jgi:hypothetical protein
VESLVEETNKFLKERGLPSRTRPLLIMISGSQAYNLAHHSSDLDYLGVYQIPTQEILGLHSPLESASTLPNEPPPDMDLHEIRKFCELLIEGNPFIIETLFNELPCYCSEPFLELKVVLRSLDISFSPIQINIHSHSFSFFTFILIHSYSFIFIHIHSYSFIFIHIHSYSFIFILIQLTFFFS